MGRGCGAHARAPADLVSLRSFSLAVCLAHRALMHRVSYLGQTVRQRPRQKRRRG